MRSVNTFSRTGPMQLTLPAAIAALVLWVVLGFIIPVQAGAVHLLLGVGTTLLVRWWALTR